MCVAIIIFHIIIIIIIIFIISIVFVDSFFVGVYPFQPDQEDVPLNMMNRLEGMIGVAESLPLSSHSSQHAQRKLDQQLEKTANEGSIVDGTSPLNQTECRDRTALQNLGCSMPCPNGTDFPAWSQDIRTLASMPSSTSVAFHAIDLKYGEKWQEIPSVEKPHSPPSQSFQRRTTATGRTEWDQKLFDRAVISAVFFMFGLERLTQP